MAIEARKVVLESVADASGLKSLIEQGVFSADEVIAVVGKTEGNGGVNDFTRILADRAFRDVLMELGTRPVAEVKEIPMVWSGGTDGILTPHATVFARVAGEPNHSDEPRLAVGYAMSEIIFPEDIGRPAMVQKVAEGVKQAMKE
ncbi:MAG: ring-opening amidohydrolase, partial [Acidimicrobiia bacterium]|nr:ring-opening amidohydrolase [Acidimicrobiia bacterium]